MEPEVTGLLRTQRDSFKSLEVIGWSLVTWPWGKGTMTDHGSRSDGCPIRIEPRYSLTPIAVRRLSAI